MTVEYNSEVATVTFSGFLKLLIKWRGSIYKLLWQEFLIFAAMYTVLAVSYHLFMDDENRQRFEAIVEYCSKFQENIPISFILGFYVNAVVSRWWEQFNHIPFPSKLSLFVTSHIRGQDERSRMIRRTLMRYMSLGYVMTMSSISIPVKQRFPTTNHLVEAGFMLPNEKKTLEELQTPYNKYYVPFVWAGTLVGIARKEGRISSDFGLQAVLDEINAFRDKAQSLFNYDWVTIPLVYTQVATIAVYMFFLSCLMSRQNIPSGTGDMIFPFFTLLQFFFYVGWLKVAEELLNPFGEDDDDFDINSLIDRNLRTSYLIVDEMHEDMPELVKDQYWDKAEIQIPYTEAALPHYKEAPLGSAEGIHVPAKQQQFVAEDTSALGLIKETEETEEDIEGSVQLSEMSRTEGDGKAHHAGKHHDRAPYDGTHNHHHGKGHETHDLSQRLGSVVSLASQFKDKVTHHTETAEGHKDVAKKDKTVHTDAKAIPVTKKESGEQSKSQHEPGLESQTPVAPSDRTGPDESMTVVAEKVEKLHTPPPERSDANDPSSVSNTLENERIVNNILSRLRQLRAKDE